MRDSFKVASWEFQKNVRSKSFIIMTLVFPLFIIIIGGLAGYFATSSSGGGTIGIIDQTGSFTGSLEERLSEADYQLKPLTPATKPAEFKDILQQEDLQGILVIPEDVLEKNQVTFFLKELGELETGVLENALNPLIIRERLTSQGYPADEVMALTRKVKIETRSLEKSGGIGGMFLPAGLAMMMVFASIFSGATLMQSIIKEKSDRIVEIILSSISARSLMSGKVLGYGLLGLVQISVWLVAGLIIAGSFFHLPLRPLLELKTLYMFIYFILGFILTASINAIAGAGMKEAQTGNQSSGIFAILPVVPLWFMGAFIANPAGLLSKIFSFIPFFTPTTMLLRLGLTTPPWWELVLTIILLIITNLLLIRLASKIFRVGMLMYGKNANIRELIKWARSTDY